MTPAFASRLVRRWVRLYTRGLPAEVRRNRCDEIESDLWSQNQDALANEGQDASLAAEIFTRLVLGVAADVDWRLDQGRLADRTITRQATAGSRLVALLAVLGGLGLAATIAMLVVNIPVDTYAHPWRAPGWAPIGAVGLLSMVGLCTALGGLGYLLVSRFDSATGLLAAVGALSGFMGLLGVYAGLALLPIASVVAVGYLARVHAIPWSLAVIHAASAPGLALGLATNSISAFAGPTTVLIVTYGLTWAAIGLELLRGIPRVEPKPS